MQLDYNTLAQNDFTNILFTSPDAIFSPNLLLVTQTNFMD